MKVGEISLFHLIAQALGAQLYNIKYMHRRERKQCVKDLGHVRPADQSPLQSIKTYFVSC